MTLKEVIKDISNMIKTMQPLKSKIMLKMSKDLSKTQGFQIKESHLKIGKIYLTEKKLMRMDMNFTKKLNKSSLKNRIKISPR